MGREEGGGFRMGNTLPPKPENYVLRGHLGTMGSGSQEAILPSFYNCLLMDYSVLGIMLSWKLNMNHRHGAGFFICGVSFNLIFNATKS